MWSEQSSDAFESPGGIEQLEDGHPSGYSWFGPLHDRGNLFLVLTAGPFTLRAPALLLHSPRQGVPIATVPCALVTLTCTLHSTALGARGSRRELATSPSNRACGSPWDNPGGRNDLCLSRLGDLLDSPRLRQRTCCGFDGPWEQDWLQAGMARGGPYPPGVQPPLGVEDRAVAAHQVAPRGGLAEPRRRYLPSEPGAGPVETTWSVRSAFALDLG